MVMNDTIKYLVKKFNIDTSSFSEMPINVVNVNHIAIAKTFKELGFKEGAEVGVAQGNHAEVLCKENPGVKLHAVDIWESYEGYREYGNRIRRYYQMARKLLKPYDVNFIRKFSMDAVEDFKDNSLDFVYIDCGHDFKNVALDIYEWSKKVRHGGIVYGHDYRDWYLGESRYPVHVKPVVQAYMKACDISPWFVLENTKDKRYNPRWMFVRQEGDGV